MCKNNKKKNHKYGTPKESTRPGRPGKLTYIEQIKKSFYNRETLFLSQYFSMCNVQGATIGDILVGHFRKLVLLSEKLLLTASDRINRLKWCKERWNWTIFSDESNF
ncbi:hypothetical protein BpHYR1_002812 [Brachionus plicatilis]|uniref:Uncharacterized protein n=1 Tax=Brachionus plicatilis TaxID=10195 RepID=A0A3M7PQG6_BRAPC|nr:hypothetical protein BpHYR1_002812 [Brachionus plicatilis]